RTILEAGVFQETLQDDSEKKGSKITLAQAYAMDAGFFARPEIRFYGTYLNDKSDSAQLADKAKNTEFLVGVQVEAWF
ncbi:carbohydrate porin, partial [Vibrio barjaei]|uniref:carbohydrate porin n=1 Tax=Vibrio barjaei TaxID=1676683 RepID=UPI0022849E45